MISETALVLHHRYSPARVEVTGMKGECVDIQSVKKVLTCCTKQIQPNQARSLGIVHHSHGAAVKVFRMGRQYRSLDQHVRVKD